MALRAQVYDDRKRDKLSAVCLVEFLEEVEQLLFSSRHILSMAKAVTASATIAALGPVEDNWVRTWVRQWRFARHQRTDLDYCDMCHGFGLELNPTTIPVVS